MGHRRRARECAVQMLFQIDLTGETPAVVMPRYWDDRQVPAEAVAFAERLVLGVEQHRDSLDAEIVGAARNWRLERMATVDRAVLRLAAFELLHEDDVPAPVAIDEAVELAKRFGGADSGAFVNGVLDTIRRRKARGDDAPVGESS